MWADFHWLRPEWFYAIPVVLALAALLGRARLNAGRWQTVIDPALLPHVLSRNPGRGSDHRWWLIALGGVIACIALAGPAWKRIEQPVFRTDQALVVALDLSRSMDAQDVQPSRLARAKLKILDILERRSDGQTALVVYSANAFTVTPLTSDIDTIAALVNSLSTDIMPSRGSYPEVAIAKGRQLLDQAGAGFGEVLLITDGGSSPTAKDLARELRSVGYSLSILGVGTPEGAPIPRRSGGFVTDNRGNIAVPRLESTGLKSLAVAGGGRYAELVASDRDLDALLSGAVSGAGRAASDDSLTADRWQEEGPWLLIALLPLAALAFRRGWVLVLLVFLAPVPQPAYAFGWDDLWLNDNQKAARALESGDAAEAAELFADRDWQAIARYRDGDYAASAERFAEFGDSRNLYNFGNAMAMQGKLDAAIEAYERTLELDPSDEDAQYNLDLVKSLKDRQDQQQENEGDQSSSSEQQSGQGEQGDSESQASQQGDGESQGKPQDGDGTDRGDEQMSEEDMQALRDELERAAEDAEQGNEAAQPSAEELAELRERQEQEQAMEQWLRRIPDDPGGLLRRKFRYQYQRSGKDQDGRDVWPDDGVQPW